MRRGKSNSKHHEEHIDESWLIPYADLLTLLLALFIVLFASGQMDAKKLGDLSQVFQAVFTGNTAVLSHPASMSPTIQSRPKPEFTAEGIAKTMEAHRETLQLLELKNIIDQYIYNNNLTNHLESTLTDEGLLITISEVALFPSGSAELLPDAQKTVQEIGKILVIPPQQVTIAGHTDTVPINTWEFPSNWDLSSKRALNFMKFLLENKQLQPERFNATGYGEYRPAATNDTEANRAKNRRVEVLIHRVHKE
jgi:chemotaxis protein MotB